MDHRTLIEIIRGVPECRLRILELRERSYPAVPHGWPEGCRDIPLTEIRDAENEVNLYLRGTRRLTNAMKRTFQSQLD